MKHYAKLLLAVALPIVLPAAASAQTPTPTTPATAPSAGSTAAKGTVVDPSDKPQAGVPVQIVGPPGQTVAITDKNGTWSVYNLPPGDYKVKALNAENPNSGKMVTFSVKEQSFWSKLTGSAKDTVKSPQIKLDAAVN